MKVVIVEDQAPAQRILKKYLANYDGVELVKTFSSTNGLAELLNETEVDVIFLDIHLPQQSGIEFLKMVESPPPVIITSAFTEYAIEGYELNVIDYLVKPFSYERFKKAMSRVSKENDFVYVKSGHEYFQIKASEVFFIHSDLDYTELHLSNKKLISNRTLLNWQDVLNPHKFFRIHKSYIVNIDHVMKFTKSEVTLYGGKSLPIGRAYKVAFLKQLSGRD